MKCTILIFGDIKFNEPKMLISKEFIKKYQDLLIISIVVTLNYVNNFFLKSYDRDVC